MSSNECHLCDEKLRDPDDIFTHVGTGRWFCSNCTLTALEFAHNAPPEAWTDPDLRDIAAAFRHDISEVVEVDAIAATYPCRCCGSAVPATGELCSFCRADKGACCAARNAPSVPVARRTCPDGGICHHDCGGGCLRVETCEPLSGVFPGDRWPPDVVKENTRG